MPRYKILATLNLVYKTTFSIQEHWNLGENGVLAVPLAIDVQATEIHKSLPKEDAPENVLENPKWNVVEKELKLKSAKTYQNAKELLVNGLSGVHVLLLVAKASNEELGDV